MFACKKAALAVFLAVWSIAPPTGTALAVYWREPSENSKYDVAITIFALTVFAPVIEPPVPVVMKKSAVTLPVTVPPVFALRELFALRNAEFA